MLSTIPNAALVNLDTSNAVQQKATQILKNQCNELFTIGSYLCADKTVEWIDALALLLKSNYADNLLVHPAFRYWLQAVRRSSRDSDKSTFFRFLNYCTDFSWNLQGLAHVDRRPWLVHTDEIGGLRCPILGRFIELGATHSKEVVKIEPWDEGVRISCHDGLIVVVPVEDLVEGEFDSMPCMQEHGYEISLAPMLLGNRVELWSRDRYLRVRLTGTNQRTNGTVFFGSDDSIYLDQVDRAPFREAISLVQELWPEEAEEIAIFSRVIVPIDASAFKQNAFTISSRQGAIYISKAPLNVLVEMILHENAHVKLRQIQLIDPLLLDPLDESFKVSVPWRPDPRPIPGVFEGLFVFLHVAEFESRLSGRQGFKTERLDKVILDLRHAEQVLRTHARFTDIGSSFFESLTTWLTQLQY